MYWLRIFIAAINQTTIGYWWIASSNQHHRSANRSIDRWLSQMFSFLLLHHNWFTCTIKMLRVLIQIGGKIAFYWRLQFEQTLWRRFIYLMCIYIIWWAISFLFIWFISCVTISYLYKIAMQSIAIETIRSRSMVEQ